MKQASSQGSSEDSERVLIFMAVAKFIAAVVVSSDKEGSPKGYMPAHSRDIER